MLPENTVLGGIDFENIDVNAVSGATNSSTVLRKAVELALIEQGSIID